MQTIAEAAGCSRMTVSLALRNSSEVTPATRARIRQIAEAMGYRPNPLVSTLMAQRAAGKIEGGHIPLALINTFEDFGAFTGLEFYRLLLQGIEDRAAALGFYPEVFHVDSGSGISPRQLDKILLNRGIRGVIILPVSAVSVDFELSWDHYSVATLGHTWRGAPIHRSLSDQFGNGCVLLDKLHAQGCRRPGLLMDEMTHVRTSGHFAAGYYLFQKEHPEVAEIPAFFRSAKTSDADIDRWIKLHRPDVIIGHGDEVGGLERRGWSVPGDFGYANLNLLPSEYDRLGGIDPQARLIGEACVDLVVARLHRNELGLPEHPRMAAVSGQWHAGRSLGQCPAS